MLFVLHFTGLGAPHWNTGARGMIIGITAATSRADYKSSIRIHGIPDRTFLKRWSAIQESN